MNSTSGAKNIGNVLESRPSPSATDKFAFVEIIQALRRNELVAMLVDRPYLNSGIAVQFFGAPDALFGCRSARLATYAGVGDPRLRLATGARLSTGAMHIHPLT